MKAKFISLAICGALFAGCGAKTADTMGGNVYNQGELNRQQSVKVVTILEVLPARVAVEDGGTKTQSTTVGAVLGAAVGAVTGYALGGGSSDKGAVIGGIVGGTLGGVGGSKVGDEATIVDAVSLVYKIGDEVFTSTQAGKVCEFIAGEAYMISSQGSDTRIQPNTKCPEK
ncbi:hypothetical protein CCAL9344_03460 [Campylobacter sp. RM9344]|uniref:Outer membrane lipoprotein n=1 Tax=Campylobacter californiensis TaxID=1032243 RepID=A0AAW3ZWE1_9BACT|nr:MULTISPECIES: hypothetical protein [unclassified Campylobacter]MBE2985088.1 hypothetical protein [Campylobacter sp. RM6883]MBE2986579.1 hypothetical protein [Campylobacter sp. RM12919]MBE2987626.1 hypothetical protein [Campylobacter sp. RM12920]MBE2995587.1 hypothetical protein [Campylobacter sp. RM6913]MBE3029251.1 hypothetical protein [Campylobacter sp. RM9344]